jgi:putative membrane protein
MMMSMMGWGWGWGMIFNTILWVLIVGFVIYAVLSLITKPFEKKEDPALQILRERFARGEISKEELEEKIAYLKQK